MKKYVFVVMIALLACVLTAFSDVSPDSWYGEAVTEMAEAGLLGGYPDGTFRPDQLITAAEFVTITARQAGLAAVDGQSTHWAAGHMEAALRAGWYDWDELPPTGERFDEPIPRQLAVKILMRALLPDARGDYATESPKISDFALLDGRYYEPVLAAYAAGIVTGDENGAFRPQDGLSRAEACILFRRAGGKPAAVPEEKPAVPQPVEAVSGGVSENGWLQVVDGQLCNEDGKPVMLRGMSSHGLQWFGEFTSAQAIGNTAAYGANVFRVAMYTGEGGYLSQPDAMREKAAAAVDAAIANGMYVILDWHILSDGNPMSHAAEAVEFFSGMAERYQDTPNLLYEICNEPNGDVTWERDIKPYAQQVIAAIREYSPKAVILVGSGTWSQDIHLAAADPLEGENLMYTLHFYAGTHGEALQRRLEDVLDQGLAVFVTEWGVSRADGSGGVFLEEAQAWLDILEARGVSWCSWSLCGKDETSAALRPGVSPEGPWTEADLSEAGQFVFGKFRG